MGGLFLGEGERGGQCEKRRRAVADVGMTKCCAVVEGRPRRGRQMVAGWNMSQWLLVCWIKFASSSLLASCLNFIFIHGFCWPVQQ